MLNFKAKLLLPILVAGGISSAIIASTSCTPPWYRIDNWVSDYIITPFNPNESGTPSSNPEYPEELTLYYDLWTYDESYINEETIDAEIHPTDVTMEGDQTATAAQFTADIDNSDITGKKVLKWTIQPNFLKLSGWVKFSFTTPNGNDIQIIKPINIQCLPHVLSVISGTSKSSSSSLLSGLCNYSDAQFGLQIDLIPLREYLTDNNWEYTVEIDIKDIKTNKVNGFKKDDFTATYIIKINTINTNEGDLTILWDYGKFDVNNSNYDNSLSQDAYIGKYELTIGILVTVSKGTEADHEISHTLFKEENISLTINK